MSAARQTRVLLGQLGCHGDCLYATTVARQIKADYPGCHLTWAIASAYRSVIDGNPDVDEVWELPLKTRQAAHQGWAAFRREALRRKARGEYDEVFLTQVAPDNMHRFDGTVRSSLFRGYPRPITVPLAPVLRLRPEEVETVKRFAEANRLPDARHVVLFECSPKSDQSFITQEIAVEIARGIISAVPGACFVLSSDCPFQSNDPGIIDGSVLSFRENAELTKYCSLLVGCSSGISWVATSDWAKPLPMIQLLKSDAAFHNSFAQDFERQRLPSDRLIEMRECPVENVRACIEAVLTEGVEAAKPRFHSPVPVGFRTYGFIHRKLVTEFHLLKAAYLLAANIQRYGFHPEILRWALHPITDLKRQLWNAIHLFRLRLALPKLRRW